MRHSPVLESLTMTENMFGIGILYLMKDLGERSRSDSEHSAGYIDNNIDMYICLYGLNK